MPSSRQIAAIHIGAHSVRMTIVERRGRKSWSRLESLQVPLLLGEATFTRGKIDHALLRELGEILRRFKQAAAMYGIKKPSIVATSAVREASNRETVIDRVRQLTGLTIEVLEPIEETRLIHRLVRHSMDDRFGMNSGATMALAMGGGGSQLIVFRDGDVVFSETRKLGTVRLRQLITNDGASFADELEMFTTNVAQVFSLLHNIGKIDTFITINPALHAVLPEIAKTKSFKGVFTIKRTEIERLNDHMLAHNRLDVQREWNLKSDQLETLLVALPQVHAFAGMSEARRIVVPDAGLIDAMIIEEVLGHREEDTELFERQVESAAVHLGRKYHFHEPHAKYVAKLAGRLFDEFQELHGMDRRARLQLVIAALLHDIGWFVSAAAHHKHGAYLIQASEILGLDDHEREMVAIVARYHRQTAPSPAHPEFMALAPDERVRVQKMAALLRIADAMDRDLAQSVKGLEARIDDDEVVLQLDVPLARRSGFPVLERAVVTKAELFEDTFGTPVRLELQR